MGVLPTAGGLMMLFLFVESALALSKTGSSAIFGVATPLAIGAGSLLAGVLMMLWAQWSLPAFFRQKPE
ncbi:MAG: hypothetical protein ACLPJW_06720, partial [Rhodomicrobium sp.]